MSITPRGMSVQEAYRLYAAGNLIVNRKYQRKLVWTTTEKQKLIDSILIDLPIPLILLAQYQDTKKFEIIDGLQRFNAIFSFIENHFATKENKFFNIEQNARAKQRLEEGAFSAKQQDSNELLDPKLCANFLDYQLAVTIYPTADEEEVTEIFGRINSGGKQLSFQDRRQAGVIDIFSNAVRKLSSEIRGDVSRDTINLEDMPEISIGSQYDNISYGLKSDEIFWCKHGILLNKQLRESEDEEMIADILASILLGKPFAKSREKLDDIYTVGSEQSKDFNAKLSAYGEENAINEIKNTLSVLKEVIEQGSAGLTFKNIASKKGSKNPVKASFYTVFMAFHKLMFQEEKSPSSYEEIIDALKGIQKDLTKTAHHAKMEDREKNIKKAYGLIHEYFVKREPSSYRHGPGLALDIENSLRRSKVETNRYECKQGFVTLSPKKREIDKKMYNKIIQTACAIANVGPDADGYIFIGVADKESDKNTIEKLDKIQSVKIGDRFVVGIDRELSFFNNSASDYVRRITDEIDKSALTEPLKTQLTSQIDNVNYKGNSILRIRIPAQEDISFVGSKCFMRKDSNTVEADAKQIAHISKLFAK